MKPELRTVNTRSELREFVKFPFKLYKGQPYWIPPLVQAEMNILSPEKNPVFEHSEAVLYTAWQDGKMVGRIAGIINDLETAHINEKHARFGWFDFIDDPDVSKTLLEAVEAWGRSKKCSRLKGPYGFNQLDKNGMLTEGFDSLGTANTIYNYAYYPKQVEAAGYEKDLEWVEVDLKMTTELPARLVKLADMAAQRYGMKIFQPKNKADLVRLTNNLFDLLMETYDELPGFVPISDKQRDIYVNRYIRFLRTDFVCVVMDKDDQPIGFSVTMPSLSKAFQKANGKLFPFGIFHLMSARKHNDTADLALIGVKEEWRKKGAHGVIFAETGKAFLKEGIKRVQINPMLEFNVHVLALWKDFEHTIYKRRRTYKKAL